jgi:hypothetical protein
LSSYLWSIVNAEGSALVEQAEDGRLLVTEVAIEQEADREHQEEGVR